MRPSSRRYAIVLAAILISVFVFSLPDTKTGFVANPPAQSVPQISQPQPSGTCGQACLYDESGRLDIIGKTDLNSACRNVDDYYQGKYCCVHEDCAFNMGCSAQGRCETGVLR